jgi:hypothetical protein
MICWTARPRCIEWDSNAIDSQTQGRQRRIRLGWPTRAARRQRAVVACMPAGGRTERPDPCEREGPCLVTPIDPGSCHRWDAALVHILTYTWHTRTCRMLTANTWLPISRVPMVPPICSLTGGTGKRFDDPHPRAWLGLYGHDAASPLVLRDHRGTRKSTNLGHYLRWLPDGPRRHHAGNLPPGASATGNAKTACSAAGRSGTVRTGGMTQHRDTWTMVWQTQGTDALGHLLRRLVQTLRV